MIYLDNNATTRVLDSVWEAMRPFFVDRFVNPASAIGQFTGVDRQIAAAKSELARALGGESGHEFVITSGATEANNLALLGAAKANPERRHVIVSAVEHPSVLEVADSLARAGYRITRLPVTAQGKAEIATLRGALTRETLLVSIMLANNETGVVQRIDEMAQLVKQADPQILFHTDATQAVGKVPIDLTGGLDAIDLMAFSAHKFHGPKGVGALFVRSGTKLLPISYGGGQQAGLRPGTENPASLVGMATALTAATARDPQLMAPLRDRFEDAVLTGCPGARVLGQDAPRLPNTTKIFLPGCDGDHLVDQLAANDIAIATGSACAHGAKRPSHVAQAMGLVHEDAQQCIRVSLAFDTKPAELDITAETIVTHFRRNALARTDHKQ